MATEIMVEGAEELARTLARIGAEARETVLAGALAPAAFPVLAAARTYVPRDKHRLAETLEIRDGEQDASHADIFIGTFQKMAASGKRGAQGDPYYRAFVELGTAHNPPNPYMRPALDATKDQVVAKVRAWLRILLAKVGPAT